MEALQRNLTGILCEETHRVSSGSASLEEASGESNLGGLQLRG